MDAPVTTLGCMWAEHYVIQPDREWPGASRSTFGGAGAMESLAAWKLLAGGAQKSPARHKNSADDDVTTNVVPFYLPGTDDMEPRPL